MTGIDRAYNSLSGFSYKPDENDPELGALRADAMRVGQRRRYGNINELARSGLIGTSTAFDIMNQGEQANARNMEDVSARVFADRRREQFELKKQIELMKLQHQLQSDQGGMDLGGFGKLFAQIAPLLLAPATGGASMLPTLGQAGFNGAAYFGQR